MSNGGELFALREDTTSRPTFEVTLRGYEKRQVDRYVSRVDSEILTLATERDRALQQIQGMAAQVKQLQAELTALRERPAPVDRASFRDLGPMVDQILNLAEKQAETITSAAAQRAAGHEAGAERVLAEAREHAATTLRDLEAELAARRTEEEQADERRRTAAQAELAEIRALADKLRAEGEAAHARAEQEAKRINEQSVQQIEHARAEAEGLVAAAREQVQREGEAARAQKQQELAELHVTVEREVDERRTTASQKIAALHAQAQQHSAEVRRRADEQSSEHQQQLAVVQQEIQVRRQVQAELQAELAAAQQQLAQSRQEGSAVDQEVTQLQQRLGEVRQDLTAELNRLDEARRAGDAAEQHAKEVRARVQREAKRVADLAAAAVMAAAAGGADTGEYRVVTPRPNAQHTAREAAEPPAATAAPAPDPATPTGDGGVPAQREPQPGKVAADVE
ncbi:MAG: hypothetical protein V7603_4441 [Micromonosporaceae bacterium]